VSEANIGKQTVNIHLASSSKFHTTLIERDHMHSKMLIRFDVYDEQKNLKEPDPKERTF